MQIKEFFRIFKLILQALTTKERYAVLFFTIVILAIFLNLIFSYSQSKSINTDLKGTVYVEGLVGNVSIFNPLYSQLNPIDSDITSLIYEGLSKYDPLHSEVVDNKAIASHSLSVDQKEYTFYINPKAKWHDGEPLTADDVVFTYKDFIQNPDFSNTILKSSFENIVIEKIDDKTVVFKLPQKNSFFFTTTQIGILPKHIWQDVNVKDINSSTLNNTPIGNGPYKFSSLRQNDGTTRVNLVVFEDYLGDKSFINGFSFVIFPTLQDLKANIDIVHGVARLAPSELQDIDIERFSLYKYTLPRYVALFINTDSKLLKSKKMRIGLQKALDKKKIIAKIAYDFIVDTPLLELQSGDWIFQSNRDEAQGAFFDEGWKLNPKTGIREKAENETLTLRLLTRRYEEGSQQQIMNTKLTDEIAAEFKEVGVEIVVEAYPFNFLQYQILDRDYDLLLYGQSLEYNLDLYPYLHSGQAKARGLNFSNYRNIRVDQLIEDIRGTFDSAVKQEKLKAIGDILTSDIPAIYLYTPTYYYLVDKKYNIENLGYLATPIDRFANISKWTKGE